MSLDREDLFFNFLARVRSSIDDLEITPQMIKAVVDAFDSVHPKDSSARVPQDFGAPEFAAPFTVYVIRNRVTGHAYIGRALDGFTKRYPRGEWWAPSDGTYVSQTLIADLALYGLTAFRVYIHVCNDAEHASVIEAQLIAAHHGCSYNAKLEPTAVAAPPTWEEALRAAAETTAQLRAKHGIRKAAE